MEYLYHYTSLETLALILSNKTIRFNNLLYVDDIEEAETNDMGKFGRIAYVSCWTDDERESIPLWNMYTPNMHGVRIRMKKFPFKRYHFSKGEMFLEEDIETYINLRKVYDENKVNIVSDLPKLEKVEYSDEVDDLYPKIKLSHIKALHKIILMRKEWKIFNRKRLNIYLKNWESINVLIGNFKRNGDILLQHLLWE